MKLVLIAGMFAVSAVAASAQTMVEDTDGDSLFSMDEIMAAYPDLTEEVYGAIDTNGDGVVDVTELADAVGNGVLGG